MSIDVTQLVMERYLIDELRKEIERKNTELDTRWNKLQKQCSHPTIKVTEVYSSGGYDYVSTNTITTTCTICDKVLSSKLDPSHRGSFS